MANLETLRFDMTWDDESELYTIISVDVKYPHKFIMIDKDINVVIETKDTGIEYTEKSNNALNIFTLSMEPGKNTVSPNELYNFVVTKLFKYNYVMGWTNYDENGSIPSVTFPTDNATMYFSIHYKSQT